MPRFKARACLHGREDRDKARMLTAGIEYLGDDVFLAGSMRADELDGRLVDKSNTLDMAANLVGVIPGELGEIEDLDTVSIEVGSHPFGVAHGIESALEEGQEVGVYRADLIVESKIIVEIKAVSGLNEAHRNQTINYLKATRMEVGLVLNFGPSPEVKMVVLSLK